MKKSTNLLFIVTNLFIIALAFLTPLFDLYLINTNIQSLSISRSLNGYQALIDNPFYVLSWIIFFPLSAYFSLSAILEPDDTLKVQKTIKGVSFLFILTILYMIIGIIIINMLVERFKNADGDIYIKTACFVPLMLAFLLYVWCFFLKTQIRPQNNDTQGKEAIEAAENSFSPFPWSNRNAQAAHLFPMKKDRNTSFEELAKCKELLDKGIITPEEYEQLKAKLINNL